MKWIFKEHTVGDDRQGIRDGDIEVFDKTRYQSVIREAIQNSLDARLDDSKPVRMKFRFFDLEKKKYPSLIEIEKHVKACKNATKNGDDIEVVEKMISEITPNEYRCLEISDYNTKGMNHASFDAFAHSRNISYKSSTGSAGSKGMGKAAYFLGSYLHTIFVSSVYHEDKSMIFQGISRLCTHTLGAKTYAHKGYYSNDFKPDVNYDNAPLEFQREEVGTSMFVLGTWQENDIATLMKRELLNHFWLSLLEEVLIVEIDGVEYNSSNVYSAILQEYDSLHESGQYNSHPNPRQYIEAYNETNCTQKLFEDNIEYLGDVKFIISKNQNYQGRIANFRKSKMLIYKDSSQLYKGYCGIFVCSDPVGNEILKKLENATHTEWKSGNWKNPSAKKALKSFRAFIKRCIDDFVNKEQGSEISIPEFDKLFQLHGQLSGGKNQSPKQKEKKEKIPIIKVTKDRSTYIPKSFNWIRSRIVKVGDVYKYIVSMDSKIRDNSISFQVLLGSDDKSGKDPVNILDSDIGDYDGNQISFVLDKGQTDVTLTLDDDVKNSIRLLEIKNHEG